MGADCVAGEGAEVDVVDEDATGGNVEEAEDCG